MKRTSTPSTFILQRITAAAVGVTAGVAGAGTESRNVYTPPMVSFVEYAAPTVPRFQEYVSSAWTAKASVTSAASTVQWECLRTDPHLDGLALLTGSDDKGVRLQSWDGTAWSAVSVLAADCGSIQDRVFDAAFEQTSGEMLAVYRKGSSSSLYYRTYTTAAPGEQTYTPGLAGAPDWVQLAGKPNSNEVLLLVASGTHLYAAVWNGAAFGNFTTLSSALPAAGRPYACGYMLTSGKAMVVWGENALTTPKYAQWTGAAWAATAAAPAVGGTPGALELASCPKAASSDMILTCIDSSSRISACFWNGASWGAQTTLDAAAASKTERRVGIAYQPDGLGALVVWHTNGQNAVRYRTWSGAAWSGTLIGPDLGSESRIIRLAPGQTGDEVFAAVQREGPTTLYDYEVYSQTGTVSVGGAAVTGLTGQGVAGIVLPAPPAYSVGAVDKNYAAGTYTLAPGNYRNLTTANGVTLNLSSGTYVFNSYTSNNNNENFVCDASSGDVVLILATGDFNPKNKLDITATGGGQMVVHVINGNFQGKNNAAILNLSVFAYNGYIDFKNGTNVVGQLYARGNVTISAGTVTGDGMTASEQGNSRLSVMRWSGGTLGAATTMSNSLLGYGDRECFDVSQPPLGQIMLRVSRWREVGADE